MAERRQPGSSRFDRVRRPDPSAPRERDYLGKEALYSTAPTASPSAQLELHCRRCDVRIGRSALGVVRLLRPPVLWDPIRGRLWTRCPVCRQRAWLTVRAGQTLRVLLDRRTSS